MFNLSILVMALIVTACAVIITYYFVMREVKQTYDDFPSVEFTDTVSYNDEYIKSIIKPRDSIDMLINCDEDVECITDKDEYDLYKGR